jgi:PAS domain S-box-containing protein
MAVKKKDYSAIFEAANDGMAIHDLESGRVVDVNQKHSMMFGYSAKELCKGGIDLISAGVPPHTGNDAIGWIRRAAGGAPQFFEWQGKNKNGHYFWVEVSLKRAFIDGKDQVLAILRDITERKKADDELKASREQLRHLTSHLDSIREEEGKRIAREIHDDLGQALTCLMMDISFLNKRISGNQQDLIEKTTSMIKLVDSTIKTVQKITSELRPVLLDELGLFAAMEWQIQGFQARTGIRCKLSYNRCKNFDLDQDLSTTIFRIFQESLTNISRHARATKVQVVLTHTQNNVSLEVKDNGIGIDHKSISDSQSFGLIGIRERVIFRGGQFTIQGLRNLGTTVHVSIPLKQSQVQDVKISYC